MSAIRFTKMVASGNDFVVIDGHQSPVASRQLLARKICDRKYGAGADGLLVLEKSKKAGAKMRIFNADGSEAEMCGNGARCAALYVSCVMCHVSCVSIETKAGIIQAQLKGDNVKIKLTEPAHIKLNIPIKLNSRALKVNFINTGVPHAVIFVQGLQELDVFGLGRIIRYHRKFSPAGTNVNFAEVLNNNSLRVRTYERGVEDETLACGTGSVASALLTAYSLQLTANKINVHTQGGEILKVYFKKDGDKFRDVWLEGKARIVYKGVYNV
jgi:diaminopimelate epimerase